MRINPEIMGITADNTHVGLARENPQRGTEDDRADDHLIQPQLSSPPTQPPIEKLTDHHRPQLDAPCAWALYDKLYVVRPIWTSEVLS